MKFSTPYQTHDEIQVPRKTIPEHHGLFVLIDSTAGRSWCPVSGAFVTSGAKSRQFVTTEVKKNTREQTIAVQYDAWCDDDLMSC